MENTINFFCLYHDGYSKEIFISFTTLVGVSKSQMGGGTAIFWGGGGLVVFRQGGENHFLRHFLSEEHLLNSEQQAVIWMCRCLSLEMGAPPLT